MAIEGGYKPYHTAITAPAGADVRAAVATAAYRTIRGRVTPSQFAYLDERYGTYMKDIPQGRAKTNGIEVGEAAAAGILTLRANDGFTNTVAYRCSANTDPDPAWTPLLTVNHPEYPSGHAFASTALTEAVAAFFGTDKVEWTIETSKDTVPQLVQTKRTYTSLTAIMDDVDNARVWAGLHYRNSMVEGRVLGSQVAKHVTTGYFRPQD